MSNDWKDLSEGKRTEWNNLINHIAKHKTYKELICPICNANHIQYFFIRVSKPENRGGGWLWCRECYTFEHFSGRVPDWWINIESAPLEKLDVPPNWLNSNLEVWEPELLENIQKNF